MISEQRWIELLNKDTDKAWEIFVNNYSDNIFAIIRENVKRREGEQQEAYEDKLADIYLHILEALKMSNCKRLKTFQGESQLTTWLTKVCQTLSVDYFRKNSPPSIPASIKRQSDIHKIAFDLYYQRGYDFEECFEILKCHHFRLSYGTFLGIMNEINNRLTSYQIHKFSAWINWKQSINLNISDNNAFELEIPDNSQNPLENLIKEEEEFIKLNAIEDLKTCIEESLSEEEQCLITRAFLHNLTSREIAKRMSNSTKKVSNKYVSNKISRIKEKLRLCLQQKGYYQGDFSI